MLGLVKISTQPTISIRYSHLLVPATHCARGLQPSFIHPEGWRSAETALGCSGTRDVPKRVQDARERAFARHAKALARRLAPLIGGTRASRRSTVAIFGRGPVLPSPALPPEPCSELLAARS